MYTPYPLPNWLEVFNEHMNLGFFVGVPYFPVGENSLYERERGGRSEKKTFVRKSFGLPKRKSLQFFAGSNFWESQKAYTYILPLYIIKTYISLMLYLSNILHLSNILYY